MRLMKSLIVLLACALLPACALRPYYREVLPPELAQAKTATESEVTLRVVDSRTGQPLPGVRVFAGSGRARFSVTSDAQGLIRVPVNSALMSENPLVEVVPPKGVEGYRLEPVQEEEAETPAQPTEEQGQD
jgi:hypothetical protein